MAGAFGKYFKKVYYLFTQLVNPNHGLSQDLETGCLNSAIARFWGVQIFFLGGGGGWA